MVPSPFPPADSKSAHPILSRRAFLAGTLATGMAATLPPPTLRGQAPAGGLRLATFQSDVTPQPGSALFAVRRAKRILDPLECRGLVIEHGRDRVVIAAIDWLEIRNEAHDRWRKALADAADTTPDRVLLTSVHQHDAPIADLEAQRIIERAGVESEVIRLDFHEACVRRTAAALRASLKQSERVTHVGTGRSRVERIASNRRVVLPDGRIVHSRGSASGGSELLAAAAAGLIDPWLRSLSFWNGDRPLAVLSSYATHPMSYYGGGEVSSDFPGLARKAFQARLPDVFQVYASGCAGNVTAGKYNDGAPENRPRLRDRLLQAMQEAFDNTIRTPLAGLGYRSTRFELPLRTSAGFTEADLNHRLRHTPDSARAAFERCRAALGLSWRRRVLAARPLDLPTLHLGPACLALLPAEAYVEYQLFAQALRPDAFTLCMGYGECGPGYIPTEQAWAEGDSNLRDWCWVDPGAEAPFKAALRRALA